MRPRELTSELEVLRDVSRRLEGAGIAFMLTGSMAVNYYAVPRMTRDIDLVVEISTVDAGRLVALFEPDYYVSRNAVDEAITHQTSFNLIHAAGIVKVDCIPLKRDAYHLTEFGRRRRVSLGDFATYIVTREDLVLAKLLWARESRSEVQLRDVRNLLGPELDGAYVREWVTRLVLDDVWEAAAR